MQSDSKSGQSAFCGTAGPRRPQRVSSPETAGALQIAPQRAAHTAEERTRALDSGFNLSPVFDSPFLNLQTSILTKDVRLFVRVPPIISDNSTRSIITSTGKNATLECFARGQPKPRVSWRRENNNLLPTGGSVYRGE